MIISLVAFGGEPLFSLCCHHHVKAIDKNFLSMMNIITMAAICNKTYPIIALANRTSFGPRLVQGGVTNMSINDPGITKERATPIMLMINVK